MTKKAISILILSLALFLAFNTGIKKQEKSECLKWQKQAKEFTGFYLTKWQKEQCKNYNVKVEIKKEK